MAKRNENSTQASVDLTKALMHGSSGIKKKIRDISRLLTKDTLQADVRVANERALSTLKLELEKIQSEQKAKKVALRYHKVRFFEKKKAIRFYKKSKREVEELETKLNEVTGESERKDTKKQYKKAKRVFEHCKIDLAYILNYPKDEKYISLYTKTVVENLPKKAIDGINRANQRKEALKKMFAEQLANNELPISLEEGLSGQVAKDSNNKNNGTSKKTTNTIQNVDDMKVDTKEKEEDDFFE